jgi:signal transduction histidine kinase
VESGRLESGAMAAEFEQLDAGRVLDEAYEAAWAAATDASVDLERSAGPGIGLRADRSRLLRTLHYLIEGAVKRTPAGGRVTVSVERRGDEAIWSIGDSGPELGGAADQREAGAASGGGSRAGRSRPASALGWALARGVVRAHGGRLWIERRSGAMAGSGNVVRIALPLGGA